jgi:hypothetical protein
MSMLEAREGEPEVIEPVRQRFARDRETERGHVSEVGQAQASRRMLLAEHHVAAWAVKRPPVGDAPLQSAADAGDDLGMPPANLLEHRDGARARRRLKHRHDLALPHGGERVGTAAAAGLFLV